MSECSQTFTGDHVYGRRKRQLKAPDGGSYHPTVKESWVEWIACSCGKEMPSSMMAEFVAAEKESKRISSLHFGGEQGEQAALGL